MDNNRKIYITKPFLPPEQEFNAYVHEIWNRNILTNHGPLVGKFEKYMTSFLQVPHFHFLQNGTIALQLAIKALGINSGEIITTPFSYVATTSSILWQSCTPVFVDIEPHSFTIDVSKIEKAITPHTKAIMPVHVFGYPCDVEALDVIAKQYGIPIIYDGAHAFAAKYKGASLLSFGDITTVSFHSTKLFHTVEGGACIIRTSDINKKIEYMKRFGHFNDTHYMLGINAKNSEFHAAMGLANFPYLSEIIEKRKNISNIYDAHLAWDTQKLTRSQLSKDLEYNYGYYPILFKDEATLLRVFATLAHENIFPRRYFYPSLNTLPYVNKPTCPISQNISSRIACLPLYPDLQKEDVLRIIKIINETV